MSAQIKDGGVVDVLADLQGVVRIAKAASLGVTGNKPRIERAEAAIAAVAELIEATDCFTCAIAEDSSYRDDLLSAIRELERASFVEQLNRVRAAIANAGGAK